MRDLSIQGLEGDTDALVVRVRAEPLEFPLDVAPKLERSGKNRELFPRQEALQPPILLVGFAVAGDRLSRTLQPVEQPTLLRLADLTIHERLPGRAERLALGHSGSLQSNTARLASRRDGRLVWYRVTAGFYGFAQEEVLIWPEAARQNGTCSCAGRKFIGSSMSSPSASGPSFPKGLSTRIVLAGLVLLGAASAIVGGDFARYVPPIAIWAGLIVVLLVGRSRTSDPEAALRSRRPLLLGLAILAVLSYGQFGRFHGEGRFVHHHELYHYALGSKYFDELGHDGLYVATYRALVDLDPARVANVHWIKNLRTYELEGPAVALARARGVDSRFTPERRDSFRADVRTFAEVLPSDAWRVLLIDHGYNATPFWNALGGAWVGDRPITEATFGNLAALDVGLLIAAFIVAFWAFGLEVTLLFAIFFFANFLSPFGFTGGALLRHLWFVALVVSLALWKKNMPILAGVAFGVAVLDRIFPLVLGLVPLVLFLRSWREAGRPDPRWARYWASFLVFVALGALATGGGGGEWVDFYRNIAHHEESFFLNQVALRNLFVVDPVSAWNLGGAGWDEAEWWRQHQQLHEATLGRLFAVRVFAVLAAFVVAWRARQPWSFFGVSCLAPFILFYPANYYFAFLALGVFAFAHNRGWIVALGGFQLAAWLVGAVWSAPPEQEFLNWILSVLLAALFLGSTLVIERGPRWRIAIVGLLIVSISAGAVWDSVASPSGDRLGRELDLTRRDVVDVEAFDVISESMAQWGNGWARQDHLLFRGGAPDASAGIRIDPPEDGVARLRVRFTTSSAFGRARLAIDGDVVTEADLYSPELGIRTHDVGLDRVRTEPFILQVLLAGKHPRALESHLALDSIVLVPPPDAAAPSEAEPRQRVVDRARTWFEAHPVSDFDGTAALVGQTARVAKAETRTVNPILPSLRGENPDPLDELEEYLTALLLRGPTERPVEWVRRKPAIRAWLEAPVSARRGRSSLLARHLWNRLAPEATLAVRVDQSVSYWEYHQRDLFRAVGVDFDPERHPWVQRSLREIVSDLEGWTDFGRRPPPEDLGFTEVQRWVELGSALAKWGTQAEDPELLALTLRLLRLTGATDRPGEEVERVQRNVLERLATWQEADGAFGPSDPTSPLPRRRAVLAVLIALQ